MPELPEVETIRRDLAVVLIGKKITDVKVLNSRAVKINADSFKKSLLNKKIKDIERIGKLMMVDLGDDNFLLIHLKMTGQLIYRHGHQIRSKALQLRRGSKEEKFLPHSPLAIVAGGHNLPVFSAEGGSASGGKAQWLPTKYTWVAWKFNDGGNLYFNDMRKFGYLKIVDKKTKETLVAKYGIEPLTKNFTLANFKKVLANRKTSIKSVLLNQALVAGIGNIYADEICFAASVRPDQSIAKLSEVAIKKLFTASEAIIKKAIAHKGTTFKDYVNAHGGKGNFSDFLKVYQRDGEKCLRCKKGIITKNKVSGRSSHYCPVCQKVIN